MFDKRAHCLGAAQIARRCSVTEARVAIYAKELSDAFGDGDSDAGDVAAGRHGLACARDRASDLAACCAAAGY